MPGPGRPTELIMPPPGASLTRNGGVPSDAKMATDFAGTAPSPAGGHNRATSSPWPTVPYAATIGLGRCNEPRSTERSTVISYLEPELSVVVVLLQRPRVGLARELLADARGGGNRGRDRRHARDAVRD